MSCGQVYARLRVFVCAVANYGVDTVVVGFVRRNLVSIDQRVQFNRQRTFCAGLIVAAINTINAISLFYVPKDLVNASSVHASRQHAAELGLKIFT